MAGSVALAVIAVLGVMVVTRPSQFDLEQRLGDGAVWLASNGLGGVSLIDGASGEMAISLKVARPGDQLEAHQWGSDSLIVNRTSGSIQRLSGVTWSVMAGPIRFFEPGDSMEFVGGSSVGWVLTTGLARAVDMETLEIIEEFALSADIHTAATGQADELYLSGSSPDSKVQMLSIDEDEGEQVGMDGPVRLFRAGSLVGAVGDGELRWIPDGVSCESLPFPDGAFLEVGGDSDRVAIVSDDGVLVVWDHDRESCPAASAAQSLGAGRYGAPVLADGWGLVPDYASGSIYFFQGLGQSVRQLRLENLVPGSVFELVSEGNRVWYNDPETDAAGVVDLGGNVVTVTKYSPGDGGFVAAPIDDSSETQGSGLIGESTTTTASDSSSTPVDTEPPTTVGLDEIAATPTTLSLESATTTPLASTTSTSSGDAATSDPATTIPAASTTTSSTIARPAPDQLQIRIAASATEVIEGESIDFGVQRVTGIPVSFDWSVSPSATISGRDTERPSILFTRQGSYTVSVEACNASNVCDTDQTRIAVKPEDAQIDLVAAVSGASSVMVGESVTLSDASQGSPSQFSWGTDGGSPSGGTGPSITVSWASAGRKTVTLDVSGGGQADQATKVVTVVAPTPDPALFGVSCNPVTREVGQSVTCSLSGDTADFTDFRWTSTAILSSPTSSSTGVSVASAGAVTVTLSALDIGTSKTVSESSTVEFTQAVETLTGVTISGGTSLKEGEAGTFSGTASGATATGWAWSVDGGGSVNSPSSRSTTISWPSAGTYTISLQATGPSGELVSDAHTVTVSPPVPPPCSPSVSVSGDSSLEVGQAGAYSGSDANGCATGWSWTVTGGGSVASPSSQNTGISWGQAGSYTVTVTATGPGGAHSDSMSITVSEAPHEHNWPTSNGFGSSPTHLVFYWSESECVAVSWTLTGPGISPMSASSGTVCNANHETSTQRKGPLLPGETYTLTATFTHPDGHQVTRTVSGTTQEEVTVDPMVVTGWSVNPAAGTATATTNHCSTTRGTWVEFNGQAGGPVPDHTACSITHTFAIPAPISGLQYGFQIDFTSTENGSTVHGTSQTFTFP